MLYLNGFEFWPHFSWDAVYILHNIIHIHVLTNYVTHTHTQPSHVRYIG